MLYLKCFFEKDFLRSSWIIYQKYDAFKFLDKTKQWSDRQLDKGGEYLQQFFEYIHSIRL